MRADLRHNLYAPLAPEGSVTNNDWFILTPQCVVESLLHDSPVSGLLWESCSVAVACVRTQQCHGRVWRAKTAVVKPADIMQDRCTERMLLADRGQANHDLLRLLCQLALLLAFTEAVTSVSDRHPTVNAPLYPKLREATALLAGGLPGKLPVTTPPQCGLVAG